MLSGFLTMARTAKRGIRTAAAMAVCVVCLVVAAAMVMVPVRALAHRQADQLPPVHARVDRVATDVAWDAARVSDVALADDFSQRSPAHTGQLADIGQAGHLDAVSLLHLHVPAEAQRDACADFAGDVARGSLVDVRSHPGQATVVLGHSVAGPFRRIAMPRRRVAHAEGRAAVIRAVGAEWHGSVTSTRLVWPVDAFGQRLPVEPAIRNHLHPRSLLAQDERIARDAGSLHDHAAQLTAAARASEPDSARGPSTSPGKWTPEVSDHIRFHFRGLFTYCVSA